MSEFGEQDLGTMQKNTADELNLVLERLNRSIGQLSDVKRQVAVTGKVIDLYWQLESKTITIEDYRKRLMAVLKEW